MTNPIIIMGSSRSYGETRKSITTIIGEDQFHTIPFVDLSTLTLSPFDYDHKNRDDDYFPLMNQITNHDLIILATPVYWYTMSSQMKTFIDRLSDLLDIRKDLDLRGKSLYVIASYGTSRPIGFEDSFSQTCDYMGMIYKGCSFIYHGEDRQLLQGNVSAIEQARSIIFDA